jgi:hypothetical protein
MSSDQAVYQSEGLWRGPFLLEEKSLAVLRWPLRVTYFFCCHSAIRLLFRKKFPKWAAQSTFLQYSCAFQATFTFLS